MRSSNKYDHVGLWHGSDLVSRAALAAQQQRKKRTNDVLQTADIFTRYGQAAALRNLGPLRRRVYGRDGSSTERLRLSITRLLSLRKPNKTSVVGACRPVIDW